MESTLARKFGEVIKKHRVKLVCRRKCWPFNSGLHKDHISFLERGMRQPTLESLFLLAEALEVEPQELIRQVREM